ncbi:MAG TPA: DUF5658 family protein [Burkholderiales bacterium]|nr:DUF5658 family protein [Burkholderiales bacterium]
MSGCATLASEPVVVGCQAADTVTTVQGLERGGREVNPIVAGIIAAGGITAFVATKVGITLVILHYHSEISTGILATANVLTCGAAAHNATVLKKLPPKDAAGE